MFKVCSGEKAMEWTLMKCGKKTVLGLSNPLKSHVDFNQPVSFLFVGKDRSIS